MAVFSNIDNNCTHVLILPWSARSCLYLA